MGDAGRVAFVLKGAYDGTVTYEKLDVVTYEGSSYAAKQATSGNLPTNTTYWQIVARSGSDTDYGTSSTASATAAKVVATESGEFVRKTGANIVVKFANANTATNPTINVDSTGAYAIYANNEPVGDLEAGVYGFVFTGTYYEMIGGTGGSGNANVVRAPYEESPSVNAYNVGDYLYYDDKLYQAKISIAIGDTLVVDTNIELTDFPVDTVVSIDDVPGGGSPAQASITLSSNTATVSNVQTTATVIATINSDGTPTVSSSDSSVATATISNGTITVTGVGTGSATITVSTPASASYTAASATISVTSEVFDLVLGNTYFFGGFYWTAAESIGTKAVCLQSQGMTGGTWPAYKLTTDYTNTKNYGSANTAYNSDIDGDNIANYDATTQAWYAKYSAVEKTGASYGSGLFLVSNAKCGTTTTGTQGSGNYWSGLYNATTNYNLFGSMACSWIGNANSTKAWYINGNSGYEGKLYNGNLQSELCVIAPAFNLDLTKVKIVDNTIIPLSEANIPTGSTVTPTNSIGTWLRCAGIFDKLYATPTEVLADSSTLATLISSQNAVDYMVRSTSWATDICANQTAMSLIGLNNYCANTLLSDSTWLSAIANSTYIESVMNVKVPTMTSNTTPSGECFGALFIGATNYYEAFDGIDGGDGARIEINGYVGYIFPSAKRIYKCKVNQIYTSTSASSGPSYMTKGIKMEASNDGNNWVTVGSYTKAQDANNYFEFMLTGYSTPYKYYRYTLLSNYGGNYSAVREMWLYGREDV